MSQPVPMSRHTDSEDFAVARAAQPGDAQSVVPRHVAVVMDGNGRWAKKRFMPRAMGHKQGVDTLVRAIHVFAQRGVEFLTVFAFSSENWKRPQDEVSGLMSLVLVAVSRYLDKLHRDGVRVRVVGDRTAVSAQLRDAWDMEFVGSGQEALDLVRRNGVTVLITEMQMADMDGKS